MARNEIVQKVKEYIRNPVAWPGGYPVVLYMADGECLCSKCAKENYRLISQSTRDNARDGWQAYAVDLHMEGEPLVCAHCSTEIESAYGIPGDE